MDYGRNVMGEQEIKTNSACRMLTGRNEKKQRLSCIDRRCFFMGAQDKSVT